MATSTLGKAGQSRLAADVSDNVTAAVAEDSVPETEYAVNRQVYWAVAVPGVNVWEIAREAEGLVGPNPVAGERNPRLPAGLAVEIPLTGGDQIEAEEQQMVQNPDGILLTLESVVRLGELAGVWSSPVFVDMVNVLRALLRIFSKMQMDAWGWWIQMPMRFFKTQFTEKLMRELLQDLCIHSDVDYQNYSRTRFGSSRIRFFSDFKMAMREVFLKTFSKETFHPFGYWVLIQLFKQKQPNYAEGNEEQIFGKEIMEKLRLYKNAQPNLWNSRLKIPSDLKQLIQERRGNLRRNVRATTNH